MELGVVGGEVDLTGVADDGLGDAYLLAVELQGAIFVDADDAVN